MSMQHREPNTNRTLQPYGWLLFLCTLVFNLAIASAADDMTNGDVAIQASGDALARNPDLPWYDAATDDFRAAEVEPPRRRTMNTNTGLSNVLLYVGWMLLALFLIYLVFLIVRAFLNQEVSESVVVEREAVGADVSRVDELPVALGKSPADYLDEAQRLYRRGDYALAVVYLFSHQLLQLDRRHWVRLVKGKTNRQYLREIRHSSSRGSEQVAVTFNGTVLLFEEVFFGKRLPSGDRLDEVWQNIDRFETLVALNEERAA